MVLSKRHIFNLSFIFLTGCASLTNNQNKDSYTQGYRHGVQEKINDVAAQFQGGKFPYYHWSSPIVQEVRIPAHLSNGIMIPEHDELVIIEPGQWSIQPAYPIQTQENKKNENQISYMDMDAFNITAMPKSSGTAKPNDSTSRENQDHSTGMGQSEE